MDEIEYQPTLVFTVQQAGVLRFSTANFHLDISFFEKNNNNFFRY